MPESDGVDPAAVRGQVAERLPEHLVPSAVVVLPGLPLTANGKLDRRALPAPDATPGQPGYVAPRTATEQAVAEIWAEVLKLDPETHVGTVRAEPADRAGARWGAGQSCQEVAEGRRGAVQLVRQRTGEPAPGTAGDPSEGY